MPSNAHAFDSSGFPHAAELHPLPVGPPCLVPPYRLANCWVFQPINPTPRGKRPSQQLTVAWVRPTGGCHEEGREGQEGCAQAGAGGMWGNRTIVPVPGYQPLQRPAA
eukprot:3662774-Rhodomonas_salina.3